MKFKITLFLVTLFPSLILANSNNVSAVGLDERIDKAFQPFSDFVSSIVFFEVFSGAPFVIVLLVISALFFTLYFGFPNIKYFGKAINDRLVAFIRIDDFSFKIVIAFYLINV